MIIEKNMLRSLRWFIIVLVLSLGCILSYRWYMDYQRRDADIQRYRVELQKLQDVRAKLQQQQNQLSRMPGAAPPPPPTALESPEIKFKFMGLIELSLSEANSWNAVAKILTTILGTLFGVKLINMVFKRWEPA